MVVVVVAVVVVGAIQVRTNVTSSRGVWGRLDPDFTRGSRGLCAHQGENSLRLVGQASPCLGHKTGGGRPEADKLYAKLQIEGSGNPSLVEKNYARPCERE